MPKRKSKKPAHLPDAHAARPRDALEAVDEASECLRRILALASLLAVWGGHPLKEGREAETIRCAGDMIATETEKLEGTLNTLANARP